MVRPLTTVPSLEKFQLINLKLLLQGREKGQTEVRGQRLPSQRLHLELRRHSADLGGPWTHRSGHEVSRGRRSRGCHWNRWLKHALNFFHQQTINSCEIAAMTKPRLRISQINVPKQGMSPHVPLGSAATDNNALGRKRWVKDLIWVDSSHYHFRVSGFKNWQLNAGCFFQIWCLICQAFYIMKSRTRFQG